MSTNLTKEQVIQGIEKQESPYSYATINQTYRVLGEPSKFVALNILLFWGIVAILFWTFNPIKALPTVSEMLSALSRLYHAAGGTSLLYNVYVTLRLQVFGLFYAVFLSVLFSYLSILPFFRPFNKFVQLLRYIPVVGFTVIFYAFFSIGFAMKAAMLTVGLTFFLTTAMSAVVDGVPKIKYELAKSLGYSDWQIFWEVIFKPTMPLMIEMVRQNAAMGWLMIVSIETFNRTEGGMGAMLQIYSASSQLAEVYTYLSIIALIALIEDGLFLLARWGFFPYTRVAERA
jgi:ABC-type nitrate/sulfonate/bicarbonate transport system permease component